MDQPLLQGCQPTSSTSNPLCLPLPIQRPDERLPSHGTVVSTTDSPADTSSSVGTIGGRSSYRTTRSSRTCLTDSPRTPEAHLLRGVPPARMLRRFGQYVRINPDMMTNDEKKLSFQDSEMCDEFDIFLSHRWAACGVKKYLALLFHFAFEKAFRVATIATVVCYVLYRVLVYYGLTRPCTIEFSMVPPYRTHYTLFCMVVGEVVLILALITVPYFLWSERVFIDYLCIDQTDEDGKRSGAMTLPDFLYKSKTLLVLWDREYFTRLWTTWEIAAFAWFHRPAFARATPGRQMVILPVIVPSMAIPAQVFIWGLYFCVQVAWQDCQNLAVCVAVCLPALILPVSFLAAVARQYTLDRMTMRDQIEFFDVDQAHCKEQEDRTIILDSVKEWYGTLEHFNHIMRKTVARDCQDVFCSVPPYRTLLFLTSASVFFFLDVSPLAFDAPLQVRLAWGLVVLIWTFCSAPLNIAFLFTVGAHFARTKPEWSAVKYNIVVTVLVALEMDLQVGSMLASVYLSPRFGLLPVGCVAVVQISAAIYTFASRKRDLHLSDTFSDGSDEEAVTIVAERCLDINVTT
eukprot:TRINITY_DN13360_c0_g1_i1.p1 TRINITY_DN13360_c0_g1~~TRINITY_DN13360_c0_g1_i1.p1  ORF type:complete len:573 (+),score=34.46 TRINITY_DN13360_c0_g1_i1:101-1819(+)